MIVRTATHRLLLAYLLAIGGTWLVVAIRFYYLQEMLGDGGRFLMFFFPIIGAAYIGGFWPGFVATVISAGASRFFFIEPIGTFDLSTFDLKVRVGLFVIMGLFIAVMCDAWHRERKRRESNSKALEESEARIRLVIDTALDAVIVANGDGRVTEWNAQAENIFGWTREEALGKDMADIIIPPQFRDAHHAGMERYLTEGKSRILNTRIEVPAIHRNGNEFPLELTVTAQNWKNEHHFTAFARDITVRKAMEEQLQSALVDAQGERDRAESANMAKTEFLANMSHEIRTPMNAVVGLSNILSISEPLTQNQKEYIKTLQLSADALLSLLNDLLDISKIEARSVDLERIPFSLNRLLQEVGSMMTVRLMEKNLTFTMRAQCVEDKIFVGDPVRLRQILLNLCNNAIKFTERGGVEINVACHTGTTPDLSTITLAVKDTGIGISEAKLATIFEKFTQADTSINRKYGGTGLGLAIARTLAEIMSGTLTVDSAVDVGSTFTLQIPLTVAPAGTVITGDLPPIEPVAEPDNGLRVLLVEDNAANVRVAGAYLDLIGLSYDVANNGVEALARLKQRDYIAILMDVQMHGMNGFEATRLIRSQETQQGLPRKPIIGVTAHAMAGDRERCLGSGMDDYIPKPFTPDELRQSLQKLGITVH